MDKSKLITLLRTLNAEELPAFHKYLRQLHGGEKVALQVFEYLRKFSSGFKDDKKLDIDYVCQKLFGSEKDGNPRRKTLDALSDLHLWLKDFLIAKKLESDSLENQALWLGILKERELTTEYGRQATRFHEATKVAPKKSTDIYLLEVVGNYSYHQHLSSITPLVDIQTLQQCVERIETCMEAIKLKMICQMVNRMKMVPSSTSDSVSIQLLEAPGISKVMKTDFLLQIYQDIYQLIKTSDEKYYNRIETTLLEQANQIDSNELHGIISHLRNYAAKQIREGKADTYMKKIHNLDILVLKEHIFNKGGLITTRQFANIVSAACTAKDFEWVSSFITEYSKFLPNDQYRDDTIFLAQGTVSFAKKDFEEALTLLESVEFKDTYNSIHAKALILRSYFELDKADLLDYCMNFQFWLGRHREPKREAVEAIIASVRIIRMLILKKIDRQTILNRIEKAPNIYFKDWLKEKAEIYIAKYAPRKRNK